MNVQQLQSIYLLFSALLDTIVMQEQWQQLHHAQSVIIVL